MAKSVRFNCEKAAPIIRQIVGRRSVGESDAEVAKYAASRLQPGLPKATVDAVKRCAVKMHHANQQLYRRVMRGRFGNVFPPPRRFKIKLSGLGDLHDEVAKALGWSKRDTQSFSLQSLRELVRTTHPKLAHEITQQIQSGEYIIGPRRRRRPR